MLFWMIIKVAFKSLLANKLRSVLAMLGIIIGVGAVIAMLAIGNGAKQSVMSGINKMGTNLLIVRPAQRGTGGVMLGIQQNLTVNDALALLKLPGIRRATPVASGSEQVKYLAQNTHTSVMGVAATYFDIRNYEADEGAFFTDADVEGRLGRVAVIGPVTASNLFGTAEPVGKTIKVAGINFLVVGTFKSKGDQGFFNTDDQIFIPYRTGIKELFGVTSTIPNAIHEIDIETDDGADADALMGDVDSVIRRLHRTEASAPSDVEIRSQADLLQTMQQFISTFTILIGSVAGISLLIGGIGIMNIMLVTVTERTREIGVRKAIGAKDRDVRTQFLIESVIMSGVGGILGVFGGIGVAKLIGLFSSTFKTSVSTFSIVLALSFATAVGVFFGLYPAIRASKLDPIEALRYE